MMLKRGKTNFPGCWCRLSYFKNGKPEKRYFANVAGMAYDAFVVKKTVEGQSAIFSNKLFYLISLMRYLFEYKLAKGKNQILTALN